MIMSSSLQCSEFEIPLRLERVNKTRFVFLHINDKYHRMTNVLLVFSRHYILHSRVSQLGLPLLDGHASDHQSVHVSF